jgi:hypothetical protein
MRDSLVRLETKAAYALSVTRVRARASRSGPALAAALASGCDAHAMYSQPASAYKPREQDPYALLTGRYVFNVPETTRHFLYMAVPCPIT